MSEDRSDQLHVLIERLRAVDPMDIVRRYDAEFDIPLDNSVATGVLRLQDAFEPHAIVVDPADDNSAGLPTVRFVGAHWCGMVAHDVNYRLAEGLQLVQASQGAAAALLAAWNRRPDDVTGDAAYVLCRWFDGAGKLRYRLGAHARARRSFQTAVHVAEQARLWWALPDLRSNLRRGEFEELRQAVAQGPRFRERRDDLLTALTGLAADCVEEAAARGIPLDRPDAGPTGHDHRQVEFLRGYSSVLHNLAVTLKESGSPAASLEVSRRASGISERLGDRYREAQAVNHQAALAQARDDRGTARAHYDRVLLLGWNRGALIARQNLATLQDEPQAVLQDLRRLADDLASAAGGERSTDIDIRWYTVNKMADTVHRLRLGGRDAVREVDDRKLGLARLVRPVVAIPSYKQEYANQIRPTFLAVAGRALARGRPDDALAHVEESSARDLLDMMSSTTLPTL
ncbi:MAG: hypothetical protein L0K86_13255, partial [Actinomycetia bacterium]|nr:hypothetical protein [Actinomycetes bacterium]